MTTVPAARSEVPSRVSLDARDISFQVGWREA
jgi:hypothetical protein